MEYSQNIEFNKIRTTSEIFFDYWRFMKEEWRPYCLVLGVFVLPFAFLGAYLFSQRPNELFEVLAAMEDPDFQNEFVPVGSVVSNMLLAMLCSFLAKFMGMFVSCAYVIKYMSSEQQYSFSSKRFGIDSFLPFFSQYGLTALFATIIMTVVVSFGFMLLILPGL
ncbi:MAG: hypothetical protein J6X43_10635, partial [Bacteroidales bacterium]|nr:hypothetical protein [Bacteroidales bacterium]